MKNIHSLMFAFFGSLLAQTAVSAQSATPDTSANVQHDKIRLSCTVVGGQDAECKFQAPTELGFCVKKMTIIERVTKVDVADARAEVYGGKAAKSRVIVLGSSKLGVTDKTLKGSWNGNQATVTVNLTKSGTKYTGTANVTTDSAAITKTSRPIIFTQVECLAL